MSDDKPLPVYATTLAFSASVAQSSKVRIFTGHWSLVIGHWSLVIGHLTLGY
ncbi:hypothetical protein [Calothrix sp. NIES-2100]|uniref:hypothetical protein n=1 Tax=Calothrix sp. NIES-2100 TaxID=1954172 RepID=UPI0030D8775A